MILIVAAVALDHCERTPTLRTPSDQTHATGQRALMLLDEKAAYMRGETRVLE